MKFNPEVVARTSIDDRWEQRPRPTDKSAASLLCAAWGSCGLRSAALWRGASLFFRRAARAI